MPKPIAYTASGAFPNQQDGGWGGGYKRNPIAHQSAQILVIPWHLVQKIALVFCDLPMTSLEKLEDNLQQNGHVRTCHWPSVFVFWALNPRFPTLAQFHMMVIEHKMLAEAARHSCLRSFVSTATSSEMEWNVFVFLGMEEDMKSMKKTHVHWVSAAAALLWKVDMGGGGGRSSGDNASSWSFFKITSAISARTGKGKANT